VNAHRIDGACKVARVQTRPMTGWVVDGYERHAHADRLDQDAIGPVSGAAGACVCPEII